MANEYNTKIEKPIKNVANPYIIKGALVSVLQTRIYKAGIDFADRKKQSDKPLYNSALGTPVYCDLTVEEFTYTVDKVSYTVPKIQIYDLLIDVSSSKNIVKTPIQGLNGTIKEYISDGDSEVVLKGRITGQNNQYPFEAVKNLDKLCSAPVAFKVNSRYLQNLDIDTIVIESIKWGQTEGGYSYQEFEISCCTDFPVELNLISSESNTN
jgi:hypothetical protein